MALSDIDPTPPYMRRGPRRVYLDADQPEDNSHGWVYLFSLLWRLILFVATLYIVTALEIFGVICYEYFAPDFKLPDNLHNAIATSLHYGWKWGYYLFYEFDRYKMMLFPLVVALLFAIVWVFRPRGGAWLYLFIFLSIVIWRLVVIGYVTL